MKRKETSLQQETRRRNILKALLTAALTLIAVVQLYPLIWMVLFSLKDNNEIYGGKFFPGAFRLENYVSAWKRTKLQRGLFNSLYVTFFTVVLSLLLSSMTAYSVTRMRWRLQKAVYVYALLGLYIPIHAALLPLMLTMKTVGLLGTRWAIILPYVAFNMSFCVMIFSGFMETIPQGLEEAAAIDGCSVRRTFFLIIFPLLAPAIAVLTIFIFMSAYNELLLALVLITRAKMKTINLSVSSLYGQYNTNLGIVGAALTMTALPTISIYMLMSNRVQEGLTGAAIKG